MNLIEKCPCCSEARELQAKLLEIADADQNGLMTINVEIECGVCQHDGFELTDEGKRFKEFILDGVGHDIRALNAALLRLERFAAEMNPTLAVKHKIEEPMPF